MDDFERIKIIDELIKEWKQKIHDLNFSIKSMQEYKEKLQKKIIIKGN